MVEEKPSNSEEKFKKNHNKDKGNGKIPIKARRHQKPKRTRRKITPRRKNQRKMVSTVELKVTGREIVKSFLMS